MCAYISSPPACQCVCIPLLRMCVHVCRFCTVLLDPNGNKSTCQRMNWMLSSLFCLSLNITLLLVPSTGLGRGTSVIGKLSPLRHQVHTYCCHTSHCGTTCMYSCTIVFVLYLCTDTVPLYLYCIYIYCTIVFVLYLCTDTVPLYLYCIYIYCTIVFVLYLCILYHCIFCSSRCTCVSDSGHVNSDT